MSPQITVKTTMGYGSRVVKSILGVLLGIIMFFGSFALLYWNEGQADVSEIAKTAVQVNSDGSFVVLDGQLVYVSGVVSSDEVIGDDMYLNAGDYLIVERIVEMYSWVEERSSSSDKNVGGSETTTTTYDYKNEWTRYPADSSSFYDKSYVNPVKSIADDINTVSSAKVGVYSLDMASVSYPTLEQILIDETSVDLAKGGVLESGFIFVGKGSLTAPQVGDLRISYQVLKDNVDVTLFGQISGQEIVNYVDADTGVALYRMFTVGFDEALTQMHGEYLMMLWMLRVLGFFLMWFGMMLILGPLSTFLDILPFLGSLSRFIIGLATFVVAVILSVVTIIVSIIFHNIVALIVVIAVVLVGVFVIVKKKFAKKGITPEIAG